MVRATVPTGTASMIGRSQGMGRRVLVVDDSNLMRVVVKDSLTPNGFEIVGEAKNGVEAVSKYEEFKPDRKGPCVKHRRAGE
jgi:PleD family two-component response regulator